MEIPDQLRNKHQADRPSSNKYVRCFVAMSLQQSAEDADKVFQVHIKPTLKRLSIRAFRIDEIEHSGNIDSRILREIDASDLLLADLTYARPSVYFEAGYAEGKGLNVILTCRKDHLSPASSQDLSVHFDLNHRKIIDWSGVSDRTFSKRLESHVRAVARPAFATKRRSSENARHQAEFAKLPVKARLGSIFNAGRKLLQSAGFKEEADDSEEVLTRRTENLIWTGSRKLNNGETQNVVFWTLERYPLGGGGISLIQAWSMNALRGLPMDGPGSGHLIMPVLRPVPRARLESQFPDFVPREKESVVTLIHVFDEGQRSPWRLYVHVVQGVRSVNECRAGVRTIIADMD